MDRKKLEETLFPRRTKTYCILDGAAIKDVPGRLYEMAPLHECLLRGELSPDMVHMAPYVALMVEGDDFSNWVIENAMGKNGSLFLNTRFSITEMRSHFRSLISVHTEDGRPLLFRFYDPRVFRKFLPTCDAEQVTTFFGKVDRFLVDSDEPDILLEYSNKEGELSVKELDLSAKK